MSILRHALLSGTAACVTLSVGSGTGSEVYEYKADSISSAENVTNADVAEANAYYDVASDLRNIVYSCTLGALVCTAGAILAEERDKRRSAAHPPRS